VRLTKLFVLALSLAGTAWATTSFAQQSCGEDIRKLSQRRDAELTTFKNLVQSAEGKQLDPTVSRLGAKLQLCAACFYETRQ